MPSSSGNDVLIQAENLRKSYGGVEALDGVSLEIRRGEMVCVVGPNGAGKSTLLYLLAGMIFPTKGMVTIDGMDRWKSNFELRQRSTVLPVEPVVGASPTPREYLRFLAQIHGLEQTVFEERLERAVGEMDCGDMLDKAWHAVSLGLSKKAGLIGCFLPDAVFRILDEPFAGGIDPMGMDTLFRWMSQARERGETIVFSTQVLEQAGELADRIVLLVQGRIAAQGTPLEILALAGVSPDEPRCLGTAVTRLSRAVGEQAS